MDTEMETQTVETIKYKGYYLASLIITAIGNFVGIAAIILIYNNEDVDKMKTLLQWLLPLALILASIDQFFGWKGYMSNSYKCVRVFMAFRICTIPYGVYHAYQYQDFISSFISIGVLILMIFLSFLHQNELKKEEKRRDAELVDAQMIWSVITD